MIFSVANDVPSGVVNLNRLKAEIQDSLIKIAILTLRLQGDVLTIDFKANLDSTDSAILNTILQNHTGEVLRTVDIVDVDENLKEDDRVKVHVVGTLSDGQVNVSDNDNTPGFLASKIGVGNNKLSIGVANPGGNETVVINVVPGNIGTNELNNNANFINANQAPVQPGDISGFENATQLNNRDTANRNRSNHTGTQLASTISDFNTAVQSAETNTTLSFNPSTNVLTYVDENGISTHLDLSLFLDNTNLAQITSGTLNAANGICTFTRDDNSTFDVDFSSLNDQSFINQAISTHENSIDNHDDVDLTGVSEGDFLKRVGGNFVPSKINGTEGYKAYVKNLAGLVNQTTNFENFLTLNANIPETGNYEINWDYLWSLNSTNINFEAEIRVDGNVIWTHEQEPRDSGGAGVTLGTTVGGTANTGTDQRIPAMGSDIITLSQGSHTIELNFRGERTNDEATIYRGILKIKRWS